MYQDPNLIRDKNLRLYFNEYELHEINLATGIDGGQRAEVLRNMALSWARGVIASTPEHVIARKSFGVVRPNGEIKYRFVA